MRRIAGLLLLALLANFLLAQEAEAACPGSGFPATGFVDLQSCTEAKQGSDVSSITIPVPASTASGDLLVAVVMTDSQETVTASNSWIKITQVTAGDNDGTLALFKRTSNGAEPANYTFNWGSNEQAIGYIMRFTGTNSVTSFTSASGQNNTGAAVAPNLNTTAANTLVLRIFGQDDDDYAPPPDGSVVAGYTTITEDESSNGGNSVSSSAAYINQAAAGGTGSATFAQGGDEQWAAITLGIQTGPPGPPTVPPFACPGLDGSIVGSQLVVLKECTQFQGGTDSTPINIPAPASAAVGDLMIAVINTDDNELPFNTVPTGWTVVVQSQGNGITQAIYRRIVTSSEPATYNWTLASNEQRYGYLMLFSGASGLVIPNPPTVLTGTSAAPNTPGITTTVANTLRVRIATSDDDDAPINPSVIMTGHRNITSNSSSLSGNAVSGQAVYANSATPGTFPAAAFSLDASEQWRGTTLGIEPIQFLFAHSGTLSSCAIEEVTISAVDRTGAVITGFTGTVNLSTSGVAGGNGTWIAGATPDPAENPGNLDNTAGGSTTNGQATYTFTAGDNGSVTLQFATDTVGTLSFDLAYSPDSRTFTETQTVARDPVLTVDNNCEFRITHDGSAGTCGAEPITITLVDSVGNPAAYYQGTVDITLDLGAGGNFNISSGNGTLTPNPDNDNNGAVQYQFDLSDGGQVVLGYTNLSAGTVNFDAEDTVNGYITDTDTPLVNDPDLTLLNCEVRITIADPSNESDVCSPALVTFTVTDSGGGTVTGFYGTINISTDTTSGNWSGGGTNVVNNGTAGDGAASYLFDVADAGAVTLSFRQAFPTPLGDPLGFIVSGIAPNGAPIADSATVNEELTILTCTVEIQVTDGLAEVCEAGETVTYTIRDRNGATATEYNGTLILSNNVNKGNYTPVGENGTFNNGSPWDGAANYTFDSADNGVLTVTFTAKTGGLVNLAASAPSITLDGASDFDVTFSECEFRIAYTDGDAEITDVCSVEQVQIGIYNSGGSLVTGYTGTINLSTTTGNGTWVDPGASALGTLTDPVAEDGSASYTFVAGDNGEIVLDFTDLTNEVVNINISDGITSDPGDNLDPNDPDLTVDLCTFQISFDGGATSNDAFSDACTVQQVTLTLVDRLGGNPEVNYTGTVSLTTSTLNGNWSGGGGGTLTDTPGDDDGAATYQFAPGDGNTVTLGFVNLNAEIVNINAVDGVIIEDGLADPDLDVQSCLPAVADFSCVSGGSPLTTAITIDAQDPDPTLRGRMVLIATALEGNATITGATFNGVNMTLIRNERIEAGDFDNDTTLWGMLDANLPAGAGSFNASVTHTDNDASMCAFYITDVEQVIPAAAVPDYSGQVNGSQELSPNTTVASTSVTTTENNALIMSIVSNGSSGTYNNVSPHPPIERLFSGPAPDSAAFAGSSGLSPTAATITIDETPSVATPNRHTHIVAAFNPLISGPPVATDFEPVTLFETWSGNMSYRAIGNTFRTAANPSSCTMATTASATLTLPDEGGPMPFDSTVEAAYLYWFASGDDALGHTDADVTFTDPSLTATNITADDIFLIDNVGGGNNLDYFAGYKDVTALVTGNGTYTLSNLNIQNGTPWSSTQACAGGWALIVIYENQYEQLRVVNLFHGFQPFQNSNFTLVPRNFRMATPNDDEDLPNGQVTHVTVEGDETLSNGDESLQIQDSPGSTTFTPLTTYYNPTQAEFNGTITRPLYSLQDVDPGPDVTEYYLFDSSLGAGGYEIDFPGPEVGDEIPGPPDPDDTDEIGASWGVDIDTHYVSGDGNTGDGDDDILNPFAIAEAEEITTRYSAGQDLVLLVAEVISITNAPIADIEVFVNEVGAFKVDGTGTYEIEVTNNGNGATSFGSATGEITVADTLPAGMTFAAPGDVSGDGWVCSVTLDPGAFTCTFDIANDWTLARGANVAGELGETSPGSGIGETLPTLTALVQIGDTSFFPNLNNNTKNVVRMVHSGGSCTAFADGVSPNPSDCAKSPEFDDVNNLQSGTIDINTLEDKTSENNNVHSVTTNVVGVRTDLGVNKFLNGVLEEGSAPGAGQYTIRVTNFGPDATTSSFTITDNDPAFITFDSVVPDPDWNCSTITPVLSCSYIGPGLAVAATKDLLLNVTVDGVSGDLVTNTASVAPGPFNFDTSSGNDSDTDVSSIVAAPVGSTERFLLSVSTALGLGGPTDLDGLDAFDDQDLVLYDPALDQATLFFDPTAEGFTVTDVNALHLLPNGQIVFSANAPFSFGGDNYDAGDLVRFDPIQGIATLIFDGSAIFTDPGEDIDAVYVLDNGNLVISTTGNADIGGTSFDKSDLVEYDILAGTASILVDGSDADVFGSPDLTQVDAAYIRVDPADATNTIDTYALSTDDATANIGAGGTPPGGTNFTRDDVAELDRTANESQNLFVGNSPLGVFTDDGTGSPDPELRLDGLHIIEDGYFGHFSVSQSQAGNTCEAGKITITKHQGLTHTVDTDYFGAVLLSTSTNTGTWGLDTGSGVLIDTTPNDGEAIYVFVPGDNGDVTLSLSISTVTSNLNVDVTNGIANELGSEDPDFDFNNLVTVVTYRDEFSAASFSNNDGSTGWMGDWFEIDDADGVNGGNSGAGTGAGNVRISGGELSLTSNPSTDATGRDPSLARSADLGLYTATETIYLEFDYRYQSLNASDSIVVEVSDDAGSNWTAFPAYTGLTGSGGPIAASLNVSTLGGTVDDFTGTLSVRFRINNGYTLASTFYVDDVELRTGTTDCGIGTIHHYAIIHGGSGIQCLGSDITIVGHDANHFPSAPGNGEVMTLTAIEQGSLTAKGTWASVLTGTGAISDIGVQGAPANTDGVGSYTWFNTENLVTLRFNYTDPIVDPEVVNFELAGSYFEDEITPNHDDNLTIRQAGLRFFDETNQLPGIPTQISGKPSNQYALDEIIILQALQTSNDDVSVCEPLFPDSQVVTIEFAAECDDPDECSVTAPSQQFTVNGTPITLDDQNGPPGGGADAYTPVSVTFGTQTTSTGAPLVLNYTDAGRMELHARYDIPFNNDPGFPVTSEDFLVGSDTFVVRPFGFDIDFSLDRAGGGTLSRANNASGTAFAVAGQNFSTTVTARRWQAGDDLDFDGVPDADANLTDNVETPNFGSESTVLENDVVITHVLVEPAVAIGSRDGTLTGGTGFTSFVSGTATEDLQFDEVGIITLTATLADNDYLGGGEDVQGNVVNVGRFYPDNFNLTAAVTNPVHTSGNSFTYMGQQFTTSFILEARNAADVITQNYIGDFVKLAAIDFDDDSVFHAIDDIDLAADVDLSSRLSSVDGSFSVNWDDFGDAAPGTGSVMGNLIFHRENDGLGIDGAEDGPFTVSISTSIQDSDNVAIFLSAGQNDIDVDDGVTEPGTLLYRRIGANDIEFRYGRLLIDNAFGPETEDLGIPLRIEYWDGANFVTNVDDSLTSFFFDISAPTPALGFVDSSYEAPLAIGDTTIESGALVDVTVNLYNGVTNRQQDGDGDDANDPDRPFIISAPDPLADQGITGRVLIEFDLDSPTLPFSLEFLSYDWRGDPGEVDDYDEIPDDDYTDNPRGVVEFGSYRGHDRVINWQEIYINN